MSEKKPEFEAIKKCAEWLSYCLAIGWSKSDLDKLQELWWEYHDEKGKLITKLNQPT